MTSHKHLSHNLNHRLFTLIIYWYDTFTSKLWLFNIFKYYLKRLEIFCKKITFMIVLEYSDLRDASIRLPSCTKEQYKKEGYSCSNSTRSFSTQSFIQTHSGSHLNINFTQHKKFFYFYIFIVYNLLTWYNLDLRYILY